jgi:periplasmic protein CpxP/Spy
MVRQTILSTLLAAVLAGSGFAQPLSQQPQDPSSQPSAQPGQAQGTAAQSDMGGHHRHHRSGGRQDSQERVQHLTKKLNLDAEQQAKVKGIFDEQQSQAQTVRQDSSLSPQDRRAKMMQLRQSTHQQIRSALNPDQQQKFDAMAEKHEQKMRSHGNKGNQTEAAPAPQQ